MIEDTPSSSLLPSDLAASSGNLHQRALWRLEQAERTANLGAWEVDIPRRCLHASRQWQRIHGVTKNRFDLDELMETLAYPEDREAIDNALHEALAGTALYQITHRICRANDHAIRWVEVMGELERDADGRPVRLVGAALDVTERRRLEQEVQENEERLRLTLEATNDGIWDVDLITGHVTVNDRFCQMLGYAPGELETQLETLISSIHEEDQALVRARFEQHLRKGTAYGADFRLRCKDGHWRWIHGRGKVVARNHDGQPLRIVGTNCDIHERKLAEQTREACNSRLREAERIAALGHWEYDTATAAFTWSNEFYRIFGLDPSTTPPKLGELHRLFHRDDAPEFLDKSRRLFETGEPQSFTLRIYRRDGALRWLFSEARAERCATGEIVRCFGTAQDVTVREEAQERLHLAAQVFERIDDAVILAGPDHQILDVNPAFSRLTGYPKQAVVGLALEAVLDSGNDAAFWNEVRIGDAEPGYWHWHGERWERRQDGTQYRARIGVTVVHYHQGRLDRYLVIVSDMTRLRQTQEQVDFLANFDPLTGLANRERFRARLARALQGAERRAGQIAVLALDLDRFRAVNQALGPAGADEVLKTIGNALMCALGPEDTLARLGSDEFGVILPKAGSREEISDIAGQLQRCCAEQRVFSAQSFSMTTSIGIAVYPIDGFSVDALMRHADVALKQAKGRGRRRIQFFETMTAHAPQERLHFEACLNQALLKNELELYFQPQVHLATGQLVGAEALLRWNNDELGCVAPSLFIPIAEEMGLIQEIGSWALRNAIQQLVNWDQLGQTLPRLAVNLSVSQLESEALVNTIAEALAQADLQPARIELELTESFIMSHADHAAAVLEALRELGLRLSIDDFGTGYSSLAHLHRLPLHKLKIDKSFILPLPHDLRGQAITKTIIALGNSLDLEVLAEGVETAEQAAWLERAGCTLAQGYHFDRPLPAATFARRWLQPSLPVSED